MFKRPYSFLDEQDDVINDTLIIARDQDVHRDEVRENTWCLGDVKRTRTDNPGS